MQKSRILDQKSAKRYSARIAKTPLRDGWWPVRKWKGNIVLAQDLLVMQQKGPEMISKVIKLRVSVGIELLSTVRANAIRCGAES
jgi:hypothetical protein